MKRDIRGTSLYQEAGAIYQSQREPGRPFEATGISTNGSHVVFCGSLLESMSGKPVSRIGIATIATGETRMLTSGPNSDRHPVYSPDHSWVAFVSDRERAEDYQLFLLDPRSGALRQAPRVPGSIEYLKWSPDGRRILLGVASYGADAAGVDGAVTSRHRDEDVPPWMPLVASDEAQIGWRRPWIFDIASGEMALAAGPESNVWESSWCGNEQIVAVSSAGRSEGCWYSASLELLDLRDRRCFSLYTPKDQLGSPTGGPSGRHVAVIEAVCSDRGVVAGDLKLIDVRSRHVESVDTNGIDVTFLDWRSDTVLLIAGHRAFSSVVASLDIETRKLTEIWSSDELSSSGRFMSLAGFGECGDAVVAVEGFFRAPEIGLIQRGRYKTISSFDMGYATLSGAIAAVEPLTWSSSDGASIHGLLLRPQGRAPHPLVMNIHGGPIGHWRPFWLGRSSAAMLMLLRRGYGIFLPNPRGSTGRGQQFARAVVGDMGGTDAVDCTTGIDSLVRRGVADPARLGVTGTSYGGYMSAWLVTQDTRYAAAIAVAPVTSFVTEHLLSNIPEFSALFVGDSFREPMGRYFARSPLYFADRVRTPTLSICGALDRCTPPGEALQFHQALKEHGVVSEVVSYPLEGHGIRSFPAAIDYAARVVGWFEFFMSERE